MRNRFSPACLTASINNRPFIMETAVSHEDETPYYHTRGVFPINNSSGFILGIRRKSMLEEAQTRNERADHSQNDPEFDKKFFLTYNDQNSLSSALRSEHRRELLRYSDVEIYVRLEEIEWRRSGEIRDLAVIIRLNKLILEMAQSIEQLHGNSKTYSERLADEQKILHGI